MTLVYPLLLPTLISGKHVTCQLTTQVKVNEPVSSNAISESDSHGRLHERFVYPEFLPDPKIEWRNAIREKLERGDMINRRKQIDIPEFYVGQYQFINYFRPISFDLLIIPTY